MLGFATIGRLAIGQISTNNPIPVSANMRLQVTARAGITLSVSGRLSARATAKASVSVGVSARIGTQLRLIATTGSPVFGSTGLMVRLAASPTIAVSGRMAVQLRSSPVAELAGKGGGKNYELMPWLPEPDYNAPRRKPFQPIWDRLRQQRLEEARRKAAEPPPPPPLPPRSIFPAIVTLKLDTQLDHLARLIPGDWHKLEHSVHEAEDATDAERLLQGHADDAAGDVADAFADLSDASHVILRKMVNVEVNDIGEAFQSVQSVADMLMAAVLKQHDSEDMTDVADVMDGLTPEEA